MMDSLNHTTKSTNDNVLLKRHKFRLKYQYHKMDVVIFSYTDNKKTMYKTLEQPSSQF